MNRIWSFILVCLALAQTAAGQDVVDFKELYQRVDAEMANWPQYVRKQRERIDSLKLKYRNAHNVREQYRLCDAIVEGYRNFQNDSALFYVDKLYGHAREIGNIAPVFVGICEKRFETYYYFT